MVSEKIHNYEYAPGVATYGIIGKTGDSGVPGNSLFYTSFNIYNNRLEVWKFILKLRLQLLPIHNSELKISRPYINGDYFFDSLGNIYKLHALNEILKDELTEKNTNAYSSYLTLCGKIDIHDASSLVNINSAGRLILNNKFKGIDIIDNQNNMAIDTDSRYALRIIGDTPDNDNKITFILFNALYGDMLDNKLEIYYDTALNAYHIDSKTPLLIDSELRLSNANYDNNNAYDGYSPIAINETPLTQFYNLMLYLSILFTKSAEDDGKIIGINVQDRQFPSTYAHDIYLNMKDDIMIKIVYDLASDEGKERANGTYTFISKLFKADENSKPEYAKFIETVEGYDVNILTVSFIRGIEVFTDKITYNVI